MGFLAPTYFPPSYFAPTYWGGGGGSIGPVADNLHAAIIARCEATPALASVVTGGFWVGVAGVGTLPPYAVLSDVATNYQFMAGTPFVRTIRLQMAFFAARVDTLKALRIAFVQAFNPRMVPLSIADQTHVVLQPTGEMLVGTEQQDQDGRPLHMQICELTAIVSSVVA